MHHFALLSALTIFAVASSSTAAPVLSRRCEVKVNEGITNAQRRCVTWVNEGITNVERRDSVGIGNEAHDLTATFHGATLPPVIQGRDYSVGIGNDVSNTQLDLTGAHGDMQIIGRRDGRVGILNGATGDYSFDDATFGSIIGTQHINRRGDGDVGVKNGATGGGDYDKTVWGPQVGDMYIGYSTTKRDGQVGILNGASGDYSFDDATFGPIVGTQHINRRGDGDVGVKNGATGGGDYDKTVWGPQVGDMYIGYSTVDKRSIPVDQDQEFHLKTTSPDETSPLPYEVTDTAVYARDGNNDADPCEGVPVGPSVGTTYMPMHPSTKQKRCSSTPIAPTYGGVVYTNKREVSGDAEEAEKRDGNNDADPCEGVPVGPSVGTTYMPAHPSTKQKRCSSTPIPPTFGGVVYTN